MASSPRDRTNGRAPDRGDVVEQWAETVFALDLVDEDYYDAVTPEGKRVQIKGAVKRMKNGFQDGEQQYAAGRFALWSGDHEELLADGDSWYLLVVYSSLDTEAVSLTWHTHRFMHPEALDDHLPDDPDGWHDVSAAEARPSKGKKYRLTWHHAFPEVDGL